MITLYDIPTLVPGKACSPNTFKSRLSIAFKGLPFKTEWIEMPDIEPTMKKLGAEPTSKNPDGSPAYTVPVIFDDATGKVVSESMKIAEYLEATYLDKPSLFPFGAHAPIHVFNEWFLPTIIQPVGLLFASGLVTKFNPRTLEHLRRTREPALGKRLEEMMPEGEEKVAQFALAKQNFSKLAAVYAANGDGKPYFFGEVPSYADLVVVAHLLWIQVSMGTEGPEWKAIQGWDDGRWGDQFNRMEKHNILT